MAHLIPVTNGSNTRTSSTRGTKPCDPESTGLSATRVAGSFESVAEIGGWLRVAMLGVFAPELLLADLDDVRRSTDARL